MNQARDAARLAEIKESLDDGWFYDNPNGNDIKEEIQFMLDTISALKERIRELEETVKGLDNHGM